MQAVSLKVSKSKYNNHKMQVKSLSKVDYQ